MRNFIGFLAACLLLGGAWAIVPGNAPAQNAVQPFDGNTCQPGVGYPYPPGIIPPGLCPEVKQVEKQIDQTEQQTLDYARTLPINLGTRLIQIQTLGKLLLYDKNLSVNRNEACTFCHSQSTGFTGPISQLNVSTVAYPGSVRYRFGNRRPKSYAYSPYSQILHLDPNSMQFYGGNFWDQRASAWRLQNPSSMQAQEPPLDPLEMGFPDSACVVVVVRRHLRSVRYVDYGGRGGSGR
jgi:cytochrome c peroxidase